ncbi:MAG: hypothetical protein IPH03_03695 [Tetrasphaera sp.]|nr:hypothetical protein [Tetrasphaera sp.]
MGAEDRVGGELLVDGGADDDLPRVENYPSAAQEFFVVSTERGALVAGDKDCRPRPGRVIRAALVEREADERLKTREEDLASGGGIPVGESEGAPCGCGHPSPLGRRGGRVSVVVNAA